MTKLKALLAAYSKAVAPALNMLAQPGVLAEFHGTSLAVVEIVLGVATLLGVVKAPANK